MIAGDGTIENRFSNRFENLATINLIAKRWQAIASDRAGIVPSPYDDRATNRTSKSEFA